jgi:hypothetical protein
MATANSLVPVEERPPWEVYPPARSPLGAITLDAQREHRYGMVFASLADRLKRTGVMDAALNTLLTIMQDEDAPKKTRVDAAKALLAYSEGTPAAGQKVSETRTLIVLDGRPAALEAARTVETLPLDVEDRDDVQDLDPAEDGLWQ